jgi:hypothetical protein
MVMIIEAPFITALAYTIIDIRSRPLTPRGTYLVNMHIEMPREVDMIFAGQLSDPRGRKSSPP